MQNKTHHTKIKKIALACTLTCAIGLYLHQRLTAEQSPAPAALRSFAAHLDNNWYPDNKERLASTITQMGAKAQQKYSAAISPQSIRAIIVPHAGYSYSGVVAAAAYQLVDPTIQNVIILAPSHQAYNNIALPDFDLYQIPLGALRINKAIVQAVAQNPLSTYDNDLFSTEHSVEIQLPLIKQYLPNATITPLIIGTLSADQITQTAQTLAPHLDASTLLVISSDFTHYGPRFNYTPFKDHQQARIRQLDSGALRTIEQQSLAPFLAYIKQTGATICGSTPIALLLALLEQGTLGKTEMRLIVYETSASQTHDANSVSYVGAVFTSEKRTSITKSDQFTAYEKRALLAGARATLENLFSKDTPEELLSPIQTHATTAPHGVFVTLYKNGALRGCIGRTQSGEPLYKTVMNMTRASAFEDSRFKPVTHSELTDIKISISVLTEPTPIKSYQEIKLGKHGIILKQGSRSALFLPQVATEQGWDLPTTLTELSQKAGLPADAWQAKKSSYQVFESIDFSE